jgi:NADPH-dependent glutamate synthase beta subunit-like oxidoreductase
MTALPHEIEGAIAEGCEILEMQAPDRIETNGNKAVALWTKKQIVGPVEWGRPSPVDADSEPMRIECDTIIVAVGQDIGSEHFAQSNVPLNRKMIQTDDSLSVSGMENVFSGGDCVSGPATVVLAIEAGKVAARNIDTYLGYSHEISVDVAIPDAGAKDKPYYGRVNLSEREAVERKTDFDFMEKVMSFQEAEQESNRCLRCDKYGCGSFKGGRKAQW